MKKERAPPSNTKVPEPLNTFAKKTHLRDGSSSKEALKVLLMSSLILPKRQLGCLSLTRNLNTCDEITDELKISEDTNNNNNYKRFEGIVPKKPSSHTSKDDDNENLSEDNDIQRLNSLIDKIVLSSDGEWLKRHLSFPLKLAIKEIVAKKPYDPVHYLGFWLLNYRKLQELNQWRLKEKQELDYYRSLLREPVSKMEEQVSVDKGEEEEEMRDWNFKYYDTSYLDVEL